MKETMVMVRLHAVAMPSLELGPMALLQDPRSERRVLVNIGAFEASSIIMHLEGIKPGRPLTHHLLASIMREQKLVITSVEIHADPPQTGDGFSASLNYRKGLFKRSRNIRPSDALALAVETDAPIYVNARMLEATAVLFDDLLDTPDSIPTWYCDTQHQPLHKELL